MKDWKRIVISQDTTLRDAIKVIDNSGLQLAIVLDKEGRLAGLLSDGDVRRAILQGSDLATQVSAVMNTTPLTASSVTSNAELLALMRRKILHHIPLLDEDGRVVGLATLDALTGVVELPNWVVLMVGGLGSRLMPLTQDCPKPMLSVGGKPILESIIDSFIEQGFRKFFLSVNYLADSVRAHFGNGESRGIEIRYLEEKKRLGTAGALSLMPQVPKEPFIVMNGDILTRVRFDNLLMFHDQNQSSATMAVREYDFQVPYGVVQLEGSKILTIEEKPISRFFVNAGIYALSPDTLKYIPHETFFDMPSLFDRLVEEDAKTVAYPLREYWLDIGRIEEFERAQTEWGTQGFEN